MGYFFVYIFLILFFVLPPPPLPKKFQEGPDICPPLACIVLIIFKNVVVIQTYYQYNILQLDLLISLLHFVHIDYEVTVNTKWQTAASDVLAS
jgi:hypothetical protein